MLSKQLTSKLKEEQERENQQNPSHLNVAQADRLIRTVSCKHDTNHAIRKANINVLQSFDEIKLYSVPTSSPSSLSSTKPPSHNDDTDALVYGSSLHQQRPSRRGGTNALSPKLTSPGHNSITTSSNTAAPNYTSGSSDVVEINLKDLLDQIVNHVTKNSATGVAEWFKIELPATSSTTPNSSMHDRFVNNDADTNNASSAEYNLDLFESIENALAHIDFNLKRNSDFINELTKLLDTSRAIQQEKQLKKLLKSFEDEKLQLSNSQQIGASLNVPTPSIAVAGSQSQPASPNLRLNQSQNAPIEAKALTDEQRRKKAKSFKGFASFKARSSSKENRDSAAATGATNSSNQESQTVARSNQLPPSSPASNQKSWTSLSASHLNSADATGGSGELILLRNQLQQQLKINLSQEVSSNSDYIELEIEVEKIAYHLETLHRSWSRLSKARRQNEPAKFALEMQSLLVGSGGLMAKDLEQSLFKLNWLITSKSGFSEPNWHSTVLSLTPSTSDSFIGVNLLKSYYRYVKYDFVSYKLFTRQLQLIQIGAIILRLIACILAFYSDIHGPYAAIDINTTNLGLLADSNQALHSFNFSADKFRPISWSANHVTLYNIQATSPDPNQIKPFVSNRTTNLSRSSSTRRGEASNQSNVNLSRDEQLKQAKSELFIANMTEFLAQSTLRLNIQASLANRTGYFYIVNQSTGLVLQAIDFTSEFASLREQIENNQKRIQSSSLKATSAGLRIGVPAAAANKTASNMSKGPRFFLMPKISTNASSTSPSTAAASSPLSSLAVETAYDEQLFYYYLINGCIANKVIRSGYCMAASSLNPKSPVTFWPNVKTTNCSWYFNHQEQTIVSGLSDDLVLDYVIIDESPNQRYAVVIDTRQPNKASQKWTIEWTH